MFVINLLRLYKLKRPYDVAFISKSIQKSINERENTEN